MLSDELRGIDWSKTPIRNFLDARPTPKSVAGTLIKLGLIEPSEVDDFDWTEIDYESYPTVRRLLEDYARRTPTTKLEDLLRIAGEDIMEKKAGEEMPVSNPLEAIIPPGNLPPEEAIKLLSDEATSMEFLYEISPKLRQTIAEGQKPSRRLLTSAMTRAVEYALETADRILPPEKKYHDRLLMALKRGFTANAVLRKYYSVKDLSSMAVQAIKQAEGIIQPEEEKKEEKEEPSRICENIEVLRNEAELNLGKNYKTLVNLLMKENVELARQVNTNSISPEKVMAKPPVFAYAVFTNKNLACRAAEKRPRKAEKYIKDLYRFLNLAEEMFLNLRTSLMAHAPTRESAADAIADAILAVASGMNTAPGIRVGAERTPAPIRPERIPSTRAKELIKSNLQLIEEFLPSIASLVEKRLNAISEEYQLPNPEQVRVPSLEKPSSMLRAMYYEEELREGRLPDNLRKELESFGISIDGQIREYGGDILHRVEAVNIPGYGWVNLKDLGIFVWYDPIRGVFYRQTGRTSLKLMTLPQIMNSVAKELNITVPKVGTTNPREAGYMKLWNRVSSGSSWRSIGSGGGGVMVPPTPMSRFEAMAEEIAKYPELAKVVDGAPDKEYAVDRLYRDVNAYGYKTVLGCMNYLKSLGYTEQDPDFVRLLDRVCLVHAVTGRYGL